MSFHCVSNEISNTNLGFETVIERHLLNELIADGLQQFCEAKELFIPVMRASKFFNIHISAVAIYGGPCCIYGDLIRQIATLDFVLRYKLGKAVHDRNGFKLKKLSAECVVQFLRQDNGVYQSGIVGDWSDVRKLENSEISLKAKSIIDYVFGDHILGNLNLNIFRFFPIFIYYFL